MIYSNVDQDRLGTNIGGGRGSWEKKRRFLVQDVGENPNNPFLSENWDDMKKKLYTTGDEKSASAAAKL